MGSAFLSVGVHFDTHKGVGSIIVPKDSGVWGENMRLRERDAGGVIHLDTLAFGCSGLAIYVSHGDQSGLDCLGDDGQDFGAVIDLATARKLHHAIGRAIEYMEADEEYMEADDLLRSWLGPEPCDPKRWRKEYMEADEW